MERAIEMKIRTIVKFGILWLGVGSLALGACGVRGEPETPPPLWGGANPERQGDDLPDNPSPDRDRVDEYDDQDTAPDT